MMKILTCLGNDNIVAYIEKHERITKVFNVEFHSQIESEMIKHDPDIVIFENNKNINEMYNLINTVTSGRFNSRIVFLYMSDDDIKNRFIDFIISRGVYDFYVGLDFSIEKLNELLFKPKTRKDVKEYIKNFTDSFNVNKSTEDILSSLNESAIEKLRFKLNADSVKIVYKKLIQFNNVISVAGLESKTGSTYIANNIAYYLSHIDKKLKVAYIDASENNNIKHINLEYEKAKKDTSFRYMSIDYYYDVDISEITSTDIYHYVIVDCGTFDNAIKNMRYVYSKSRKILVSHSNPWDVLKMLKTMNTHKDDISFNEINCLVNLSNSENYNNIRKTFTNFKSMHKVPFIDDCYEIKNSKPIYDALFCDIAPDKKSKKPVISHLRDLIKSFKVFI
jgi:predicted DNA-binding protein YlxM (UPF0122 family)